MLASAVQWCVFETWSCAMIKTDMRSAWRWKTNNKPAPAASCRRSVADGAPSCSSYTDLARSRGGNNVSERLWRSYMVHKDHLKTIPNFTYWTLTTQRNWRSLQFNPVTDSHLGLVVPWLPDVNMWPTTNIPSVKRPILDLKVPRVRWFCCWRRLNY